MITTVFIFVVGAVLMGLVQILPLGGALPAGIDTSLTYFASFWNDWNVVFPLDTVVSVIGYALALEVVILLFHLGEWIYSKIPFKFS